MHGKTDVKVMCFYPYYGIKKFNTVRNLLMLFYSIQLK